MVNRGGLKVHPGEVEEVLRLLPAVADAAVVGVPDDRLGEVPWAFIVIIDGAVAPDAADLEAACRKHLAPYKVPVGFTELDDLPRNEVGKVLKRELQHIPR
jgi:acyl-CoA synthetase (AMP-forming)/AMP-acid ligase II